jgi:hypothetical protein
MILLADIYESITDLLKNKYENYSTHGHEVTKDFSKPCFFVNFASKSITNESVNYKKMSYTIIITYHPQDINEVDNLNKIDEIRELLNFQLKVKDQLINITDYAFEFIGDDTNKLQIKIVVEYYETIEREDNHRVASTLQTNLEKR